MTIRDRLMLLVAIAFLTSATCVAQTNVHYINVGQGEAILLEFKTSVVLIDAGGELTCLDASKNPVSTFLKKFFQQRPQFNGTIDTIIISHPHIDHTMWLVHVLQNFKVLNLIDGGNETGSGIVPLFAARWFASQHGIKYFPVKDNVLKQNNFTLPALLSIGQKNPGVDLKIISSSRGCKDANNDSLVVLLDYRGKKFLFTGDAEGEDQFEPENQCGGAEITHLLNRFKNMGVLNVDVYKVGHHGSANGTTALLMQAMTPMYSVISAGLPVTNLPCEFHAFNFGHPREAAVQVIEENTSENRTTPATVTTMLKVTTPSQRTMKKAVYCTCWDGNITIKVSSDGQNIDVQTQQ